MHIYIHAHEFIFIWSLTDVLLLKNAQAYAVIIHSSQRVEAHLYFVPPVFISSISWWKLKLSLSKNIYITIQSLNNKNVVSEFLTMSLWQTGLLTIEFIIFRLLCVRAWGYIMQMLIKSYTGYFSPTEIIKVMLIFEIELNKIFSTCLCNFPLPYLL